MPARKKSKAEPEAPRFGVIAGLVREIDILKGGTPGSGHLFAATGGRTDATYDAVERMIASGVSGVVSFGIAGGLAPGVRPGDLILPVTVFDPVGRGFPAHAPWLRALRKRLGDAAADPVVGADEPVTSPVAKQALYRLHGAVAVDMESHVVAALAQEASLPFCTIRVVADPADRAIPWAALAGMTETGEIRSGPVILRLAARPWQLVGLLRLARDSNRAFSALRRIAAVDPLGILARKAIAAKGGAAKDGAAKDGAAKDGAATKGR